MSGEPSEDWRAFRQRIWDATNDAVARYDSLDELATELYQCEAALRSSTEDISALSGPMATELTIAMRRYEEDGRPGGYDTISAANIVLKSAKTMLELAEKAEE